MNEKCTATVNWTSGNNKPLQDAVKCSSDINVCDDDLEDFVSLESCVQLQSTVNEAEKCIVHLTTEQNLVITQLLIVSEAKLVELYSERGEYLSTFNSEFICKIDDFIVYKTTVTLPRLLHSCSIKFLSLRNAKEMWLYGIRVAVRRATTTTPSSNMDVNQIMNRLQLCDQQISDKAKGFAMLLSTYQNRSPDMTPSATNQCSNDFSSENMATFLKMFTVKDQPPLLEPCGDGDVEKKPFPQIHTTKAELMQELMSRCDHSRFIGFDKELPDGAANGNGKILKEQLELLVRREVTSSEQRLWTRIDTRLKAMENRLARIAELLEPPHHHRYHFHQPDQPAPCDSICLRSSASTPPTETMETLPSVTDQPVSHSSYSTCA